MSDRSSASEDDDHAPSSRPSSVRADPVNGVFTDKSTGSKISYKSIGTDVTEDGSRSRVNPSSIKWTITETSKEGESAKSTVSLTDLASSATVVVRAKNKQREAGHKHEIRMEVYKRILGSDIDTKDDEMTDNTTAESGSKKKKETVKDRDEKLEKILAKNADNGSKPLTTYRVTTDDDQSSTVTLYYTKKGKGGQGEFSIVRWDGSTLSHHAKLDLEGLYFHCTEYGSTIGIDKNTYTDAEDYLRDLIERGEISRKPKSVGQESRKKKKRK
ncbi:hypothetical protein IAU59_006445 [Kwoniella sp. CBS 9459]